MNETARGLSNKERFSIVECQDVILLYEKYYSVNQYFYEEYLNKLAVK